MNEREREVLGAMLCALAGAGSVPLCDSVCHDRTNFNLRHSGKPPALHSEFSSALRLADAGGWVIGTRSPLGQSRWSIATAGRHLLADEFAA